MNRLNLFDGARDPLAELRAVLEWVKQKNAEKVAFLNGPPVVSIKSGVIKPNEKGQYIQSAKDWFKGWQIAHNNREGIFFNDEIGAVVISVAGIKAAMSHRPKLIDIQGLPALTEVIKKAKILSVTKDDEGKPINNIVMAAPFMMDGKRCYMVLRLREFYEIKNENPRFYTQAISIEHEKVASDNVTEHLGENSLTRFGRSGRDRLLTVLHNFLAVNSPKNPILKGRSNPVKTAKGARIETVLALIEADRLCHMTLPAALKIRHFRKNCSRVIEVGIPHSNGYKRPQQTLTLTVWGVPVAQTQASQSAAGVWRWPIWSIWWTQRRSSLSRR